MHTASPLRIGLIAPPWVAVPPQTYGGTEVVVDNLARGLRDRGHDVVLFTVGSSTSPVERRHLLEEPAVPMGLDTTMAAHVLAAYDSLGDVDLIHDHTTLGPLIAQARAPRDVPVVATCHTAFSPEVRRILAAAVPRTSVVAISHAQARHAPPVPVTEVIHHGIDLDQYRMGPGDGRFLLFVGRMSPDKGPDRAIRIARRAGLPLKIVAKMRAPDERAYYEEVVRPLLGPEDDEPGEEPLERRLDLMRRATALLDPISWPEPFGLVMAEAMASGTPVIAQPFGAAPEIVAHGLTGYLTASEDEAVEAVRRVARIDRAACRARAEQYFSMERMVADHERLYHRVLARRVSGAAPLRGGLTREAPQVARAGV